MDIQELEKYYDSINKDYITVRDINWGIKRISEATQRDILALYKQEGTYFYQNVAPKRPNGNTYSKKICNDCIERINNLTINDLEWANANGTMSNSFLAIMNQTLRFNTMNKKYTVYND